MWPVYHIESGAYDDTLHHPMHALQAGNNLCRLGVHSWHSSHLCRGSGEASHHKSFGRGSHCHGLLRVACALVSGHWSDVKSCIAWQLSYIITRLEHNLWILWPHYNYKRCVNLSSVEKYYNIPGVSNMTWNISFVIRGLLSYLSSLCWSTGT